MPDKVAKTRSCSLLRLVEGVAKPSQHPGAAGVGGLLRGGQEGEDCPEETSCCRLAAVSGGSPQRQLGAEDGVDKPLPQSSLRLRGLVMALEDSTRVSGGNNGSCIVLKGG